MGYLWRDPYEQAHHTTTAVRHILYTGQYVEPETMHPLPREIEAAKRILDTPDAWRPKVIDTALKRYLSKAITLLAEIQRSTGPKPTTESKSE